MSKLTGKTTNVPKKQILELQDHLKRALADYQNLEKRHQTQKQTYLQYANQGIINKILPIIDDLERAQNHLQDQGLQMVIEQFHQILTSEDVTPIKTKDQLFNPETMDCIEVVAGPKNQVTKTISQGYFYHDQVIRPAKVEVGSGEKQSPSATAISNKSKSI